MEVHGVAERTLSFLAAHRYEMEQAIESVERSRDQLDRLRRFSGKRAFAGSPRGGKPAAAGWWH